jgi:hypothetical protein
MDEDGTLHTLTGIGLGAVANCRLTGESCVA